MFQVSVAFQILQAELQISNFLTKKLLKQQTKQKTDLKVYIGTHIKRESNIFLRRPKVVVEDKMIWKKCVSRKSDYKDKNKKKDKGKFLEKSLYHYFCQALDKISYRIDQEKAIVNMLVSYGIDKNNIVVSENNSFTDVAYFSDRKAMVFREDLLKGKFLVGAYYADTIDGSDNKCSYTGHVLTRKL